MSGTIPRFIQDRRYWLIPLAIWAACVTWSINDHLADIQRYTQSVVTEGARNMFRMVVLTRLWNSQHGGVYVPVDTGTPPNPYLDHPRRDITDNHGRQLTLVNPAYMTRLIGELARQGNGVVFRLTSLRPVNPLNEPDAWERKALEAFEQGEMEVQGFDRDARNNLLHRYMAPLKVVEACLVCHAVHGYKLGDVRGGISVSHPYQSFLDAARPGEQQAWLTHGFVFLLVAALCWWLLEQLRQRWGDLAGKIREVEETRGELLQSEKMASLGRMVAGFAHEINTPIGVAVGAITNSEETLNHIDRMLETEEVSEEDLRAALSTLRQGDALAISNLKRAAGLVQSFKRTSIDQASEQEREFELAELVDDVLYALHNHLKRLPVKVTVDCPKNLKMDGVPGLLEQLLTNLLMNSIVHGFREGERSGDIGIRIRAENGRLFIDYRDTGFGMPPETVDKIFEPFFTTRRGSGGSGLGMYICFNIVTARLGGTITCDSRPDAGTQFHIEFPARLREE
jgi:two-component system, NtrC family, sensor kinase